MNSKKTAGHPILARGQKGGMTGAFRDEVNIAYVGFTRAIRDLHLPPDFKTILTIQWQTGIGRYEPASVPRPTKPPFAIRKRTLLPNLSGTEPCQSKSPRKRSFKVGDRVRTAHGEGIIAEINGEKYLVELDEQEGRLWEKEWGLKKA